MCFTFLQTRLFVVVPTIWHERPALRLEIHGCSLSIDDRALESPTTKENTTKERTTKQQRETDINMKTPKPASGFFSNLPSIGGQITEDTSLRRMATPYVVASGLVVRSVSGRFTFSSFTAVQQCVIEECSIPQTCFRHGPYVVKFSLREPKRLIR